MNWFAENWFWVLFGVAFIAMHLFGHGSHGGGHCGGGGPSTKEPGNLGADKRPNAPNAHRH